MKEDRRDGRDEWDWRGKGIREVASIRCLQQTEETADKKIVTFSLSVSDSNPYILNSPRSVCQAVDVYILVVPRGREGGY